MKKKPADATQATTTICSHFDHVINGDVVSLLKDSPKLYAEYFAWNFCAYVWCEDGTWYAEVWQRQSHVDTVYGQTFPDLKQLLCDDYGNG